MDNIRESDYKNIRIQNMNISTRLKHILQRKGIMTLQQLVDYPNEQLSKIRNMGEKSYKEAIELKDKAHIIQTNFINNKNIQDSVEDFELKGNEDIMQNSFTNNSNVQDNISEISLKKLEELENAIDSKTIDQIYSSVQFKDIKISVRLNNCLIHNGINTLPEFLKTPIRKIAEYKNLGLRTFKEAINLKLELLDIDETESSYKLLFLYIKKITDEEPKTIVFIKNYLSSETNYDVTKLINDLNILKNDKKIEITTDGIKIKRKSIMDVINSLEDERKKRVLLLRLNGCTLEEIGKQEGVSRERIRQILFKILRRFPEVDEIKYKKVYEKYSFNESEFCEIFNENALTYNYLGSKFFSGITDIKEGLNTNDFSNNQKNIIRKLRNIITIFGKDISATKSEVVRSLTEKYGNESISFEEFAKIYNGYIKQLDTTTLEVSDVRSIEGILNRQDNIIFDFGRKFRYKDFSLIDKQSIASLKKAIELDKGYYSTLVIFKNNLNLMKELDIRNEYELHNFLKRNPEMFKGLKYDRMPNFSIGNISKDEFTLSKMNELSPINVNEFLRFMENNYGHKSNSFLSYIQTVFSKYINGDFIDVGITYIENETLNEIRKILTEPIYTLDFVKKELQSKGYSNIDEIITKNNLYRIGYKIRSSYILRKDYESVEEYFFRLTQNKNFITNENILGSSTYNITIKRLEKNYDIVAISDNEFITYKKLFELGINKEMIRKFCNDVYIVYKDINYFTIHNIKSIIDVSWLEDNGFDDIFYECLIETIDNIKYLRVNNQKIYSLNEEDVKIEEIIDEIMCEESIYIDELLEKINEKYGLIITPDKIIYGEKYYYNKELNKLYINKESYYKEVYNYE